MLVSTDFRPLTPEETEPTLRGFYSAAKFEGVSLNDVLMSGQDLANNLLGVLVRFRREAVAVVMDIQKMFYGRGGQSIGPRAGSGPRARFWWSAEGYPNVK